MLINAMVQSDRGLVLHSWVRSYRQEVRDVMGKAQACEWIHDRAQLILARPGAKVLVARNEKTPLFVYGWACAERLADQLVVHFIYVKSGFRNGDDGNHYGRELLRACERECGQGAAKRIASHRTYVEPTAKRYGYSYVPLEKLYRESEAA